MISFVINNVRVFLQNNIKILSRLPNFHAFISYGCKAFPVVIHVILLFVCKFLSLVFILMNIRDANAFEVNGNHDATKQFLKC